MKTFTQFITEDINDDFAIALRIKGLSGDKLKNRIQSRLIGLGYGSTCTRCGGSGHYSFNMTNGTTCFKCHGSGFETGKLTSSLLDHVKADSTNGKLDAYLAKLTERANLKNMVKNASKRVMDKWSGYKLGDHYSWMKAAKKVQPDADIADLVNKPMNDAYDVVRAKEDEIESLSRKKTSSADEKAANDEKIVAMIKELAALTDQALKDIEVAYAKLDDIKKKHAT